MADLTDADITQIVEGIEEFIIDGDDALRPLWQPYIDKLKGLLLHQQVETRAANHWFTEANMEHNRAVILRTALVGLVCVDGRVELEHMEATIRASSAAAEDKAAAINAIHALLSTLEE